MVAYLFVLGSKHAFAISEGRLYSWGCNCNGELGLGHERDVLSPTLVSKWSKANAATVSAGECCSLVITETGSAYRCGDVCYSAFDFRKTSSLVLVIPIAASKEG